MRVLEVSRSLSLFLFVNGLVSMVNEHIERILSICLVGSFLFSLVYVAVYPFGFMVDVTVAGDLFKIHGLTVFGLSFLALFFNVKMRKKPLFKRLFLIGVFSFLAYMAYDCVWNIDYSMFMSSIFPHYLISASGRFGYQVLLPAVILKWRLRSPRFQLKGFLLLLAIDTVMILWLESTGFFPKFIVLQQGYSFVDPHGWVWFIGKLVSFLAFPIVFMDFSALAAGLSKFKHIHISWSLCSLLHSNVTSLHALARGSISQTTMQPSYARLFQLKYATHFP